MSFSPILPRILKAGQQPRLPGLALSRRVRQNLPQIRLDPAAGIPVLRVPQRHLLATDAVAPVGGADVEVAVDHGLGAVAEVPVLGRAGAAPDGKAGDARQ